MAVPILSIDGVENKKDNAITAIGTLVNIGDSAVTELGFEYSKSENAVWSVRKIGSFSIGEFKLGISGLLPNATYYVRSFGTNTSGEGYSSSWFSFTTENYAISAGLQEEDETSPTICFYVRKIGGKWSIKHGPYTTDQADIKITDILTEGTGKYQIKFESDVLTGLSASIMCKLDVKVRG